MAKFCCFGSEAAGRASASSGKGKGCQGQVKVSYGFSLVRGKTNHPMEDFHVAELAEVKGNELGLFAIYDGHLGDTVPAYLQKNLFPNILNEEEFWTHPDRALTKAYEKTDQAILSHTPDLGPGGSTAVTAILINGRKLWVANVGDSRAVLLKGGEAIQMSIDHDPNVERGAIENRGGFVSNMPGDVPRVCGQLAVSRAFGDRNLKSLLKSEPATNAQPSLTSGKHPHQRSQSSIMSTDVAATETAAPTTEVPAADPVVESPSEAAAADAKPAKETKAAKAKKPSAPRKPKATPVHPTYLGMVSEAISTLKERTGSSQVAIGKFIEGKHSAHLPGHFRKILLVQLKKLVASGKLTKVKGSYKLAAKAPAAAKPKAKAPAKKKPATKAKGPAKKKPAAKAKAPAKKAATKAKAPVKTKAAAKPKAAAAKPKAKAPAKTKAAAKPKAAAKTKTAPAKPRGRPAKAAKTSAKDTPGKKAPAAAAPKKPAARKPPTKRTTPVKKAPAAAKKAPAKKAAKK